MAIIVSETGSYGIFTWWLIHDFQLQNKSLLIVIFAAIWFIVFGQRFFLFCFAFDLFVMILWLKIFVFFNAVAPNKKAKPL